MRLLVIGGSDAGVSAGLRARELDRSVEVTLVVADAYPNYSICGLPYYLSGEVADWRALAHRSTAELEAAGIQLLLNQTARAIHPSTNRVAVTDPGGRERFLVYDRLVVATGALPASPPIPGLDLPGVHLLHTMGDTFALEHALAVRAPCSVVIVGGGYIGLEMAEALTTRGLSVTLVEQAPTVMPTVDPQLGRRIGAELASHGVSVHTGLTVSTIRGADGQLQVVGEPGFAQAADLVLVVVGVRPDVELAAAAGVSTGVRGALQVDRQMRTTAHKQGRVAGENAVGGRASFAGSLGTQVVKVFELAVARTGLRDQEAAAAGFDPVTVGSAELDHKAYYPGAHQLHLRITGDRHTGRLLGAQLVGNHHAEVAKRIDIPATALFHAMTVDGLSELDLSYTPPFGSPWDAIQLAAQAWTSQAGRPRREHLGLDDRADPKAEVQRDRPPAVIRRLWQPRAAGGDQGRR
jgi:NADPH-dependent 2,4-dienoyl-CoA reductase/sulfur reductase-like enzyme